MDVGHGADELCEYALDFCGLEGALFQEVVVQLVAGAVLEDQPDELFCDYDLVQARNMRVDELAVVVYFAGEVGVVLFRRLEDDLGAIAKLVRGEVDFAEATFANQLAQRVVADALEVCRGEFTGAVSVCAESYMRKEEVAYSRSCLYEFASCMQSSVSRVKSRMCPLSRHPTHLLSLCSLFSSGPGIHEKRHVCVETGELAPSSNTAVEGGDWPVAAFVGGCRGKESSPQRTHKPGRGAWEGRNGRTGRKGALGGGRIKRCRGRDGSLGLVVLARGYFEAGRRSSRR